jgi:hypothetical protein
MEDVWSQALEEFLEPDAEAVVSKADGETHRLTGQLQSEAVHAHTTFVAGLYLEGDWRIDLLDADHLDLMAALGQAPGQARGD